MSFALVSLAVTVVKCAVNGEDFLEAETYKVVAKPVVKMQVGQRWDLLGAEGERVGVTVELDVVQGVVGSFVVFKVPKMSWSVGINVLVPQEWVHLSFVQSLKVWLSKSPINGYAPVGLSMPHVLVEVTMQPVTEEEAYETRIACLLRKVDYMNGVGLGWDEVMSTSLFFETGSWDRGRWVRKAVDA